MKVVKVLWTDSCNSNLNWAVAEDVEVEPIYIDSFGVVVKDTDEFLAIAQNHGDNPEQYSNITTIPKGCIKKIFVIHEDKMCENKQKLTDKVEPKFKVGQWIILPLGIIAHIDSLNSTDYQVTTTDGKICDFEISKQDNYRLWTIKDAKDGDVLSYYCSATDFFMIGIFKRVAPKGELWGGTYRDRVHYGGYGSIENYTLQVALGNDELHHCGSTACPATKEQRDTLFAKMKKAGYEWDAEKKEVKKIDVKTLDPDKVIEWLNHCNLSDCDIRTSIIHDSSPTSNPHRVRWLSDDFINKFKKDFGL